MEDFESGKVFEYLSGIKNGYAQGQEERRLSVIAQEIKFRDFKKLWKLYRESQKAENSPIITQNGVTEFEQQPLELNTGEWRADDTGVWRYAGQGVEIACSHPIMPTRRLRNIDTGELKATILFRRGGRGRRVFEEKMVSFATISSAKEIIKLATVGVSVTSGKKAQNLVDYLTDVMDMNYDIIPEFKSTSKMGWNEEGFSPYVDDIIFDGETLFSPIYKTITQHGSYEAWMLEAKEARTYSITARIVLAASFGSVLVEPLGCLPFFVHLWGGSGSGKSVAQMLAAAVWADPNIGGNYFASFNTTNVGSELMAGFLNSLPLFLDDLQLAKDSKGNIKFDVYKLAAGKGKTRGTAELGLRATSSWLNCFITSGETPIVNEADGAGAVNRVIEIECKENVLIVRDPHRTANTVRANYGFAGKEFITHLLEPGEIDRAQKIYEKNYEACLKLDTTGKQAMAAAIIVTADELATEWIFKDGNTLTISEIGEFLKTNAAVSISERGYRIVCDWVSQNANKLKGATSDSETFGMFGSGESAGWVFIIRSVFDKVCADNGVSPKTLLSHLKARSLIEGRGRALTKAVRIGSVVTECVKMKLPTGDDTESENVTMDELPY